MPDWRAHITERLATLNLIGSAEAGIVDELAEHLDQRYEELRAGGMDGRDAEGLTVAELLDAPVLGARLGALRLTHRYHAAEPVAGRGALVADVWRDVGYACRTLRAHPLFTAAAAVTLAIGIGVNATVFSLFNAVAFKPLPHPGADRLATVASYSNGGDEPQLVSYADFVDMRDGNSSFTTLEATAMTPATLADADIAPGRYRLTRITPALLAGLQVPPVLGRLFNAEDGRTGAPRLVLLGYALWRDRYQRSPAVLGREVTLDSQPATIVGVMPEGFGFPLREEFWTALVPTSGELTDRAHRSLMPIGMLRPGTTVESASADLKAIADRASAAHPDTNRNVSAGALTFQQRFNGRDIHLIFSLMLGAAGFVLLVACANVANMMLGRALERERDVSIRAALGASRWRIVRQLLVESLVLSAVGGVCGFGVAYAGIQMFAAASANVSGKPYWIDFAMDARVFAYFAIVSVTSALVFGLAPALRSSRVDLNSALKDGRRTSGGRAHARLSGALVVGQFSLAVVLMTAAGLLVRSAIVHTHINPFVPADRILTASIELPQSRYPDTEARRRFWRALDEGLSRAPGIERAALTNNLPGIGAGDRRVEIEGSAERPTDELPRAWFLPVSPGYFDVVGLPLLSGRAFDARDGRPDTAAAILAPDFAARFWPGENPIGKRFRFRYPTNAGAWLTVVGIVGTIDQNPLSATPLPLVYIPTQADNSSAMRVLIRTSSPDAPIAGVLRNEVRALDSDLPLGSVATLEAALADNFWFLKLFSVVFLIFAAMGLVMAAVGIYAVLAQHTARRTREIGIRLALGATRTEILRLVLSRGARQLGAGLAFGLGGAFAVSRTMGGLLGSVSPSDPVVFITVCGVLTAVGAFACWLPARRAARLLPTEALREE